MIYKNTDLKKKKPALFFCVEINDYDFNGVGDKVSVLREENKNKV